jgi:hypothetical protein
VFRGTRLPVATVIENLEDLSVDWSSWPRVCAPTFPPVLVLFDHGTPKGLARALSQHTAQSKGWDRLSNGELLNAADEAGFDLLLTAEANSGNIRRLSGYSLA